MLVEIYCDKFLQKRIKFNDGLNVVLGGAKANNSIGKSTLLQIIDYCFGGDTYCGKKDNDIRKNVGDHIIRFTFKFDKTFYHFIRDTSNPNVVTECDENGKVISDLKLSDFNAFLNSKYFPNNNHGDICFRTIVSRFMRIAGKGNVHEDKPLKGFDNDNDKNGINTLEELFGFYGQLKEIKNKLDYLEGEKKARKQAKKYSVIPDKIRTKKDYEAAMNERKTLVEQKEKIFREGNIKHFEGDAAFSKEAIDLKIQLENLLKNQSRLNYRKKKLEKSITNSDAISENDLNELSVFFPNINIKKLSDVNKFHKGIITIITGEIKEEIGFINEELNQLAKEIKPIEDKLRDLNIPNYISPDIMKAASEKEVQIIKSTTTIESYEKDVEIKNSIRGTKEELALQESTVVENINSSLNSEMERISDEVNITKRYSPKINILNSSKYTFDTPNDTGTGSKYKNIIIFDLSVLNLSSLPVLIHDSIVFKNIGDDPVKNIFKQYLVNNKQIFIAIDKIEDYHSNDTVNTLKSKTIIELDDGKELFGKSWGNIK